MAPSNSELRGFFGVSNKAPLHYELRGSFVPSYMDPLNSELHGSFGLMISAQKVLF